MDLSSQLNKRQDEILSFLEKNGRGSVSQILKHFASLESVSKITVNRDLKKLLKLNLIIFKGQGRGVVYQFSPHFNLLKPIKIAEYFKTEVDKRIIKEKFNFGLFNFLKNIFTNEEIKLLKELNRIYQKNIKNLSANLLKKEFERLTIELSWKSSKIEGNTYSLLETERLIKEQKESAGHNKEEGLMILNHKRALDYIRKNQGDFKKISVAKIENIHYLLTQGLNIPRNLRKRIVGITGTRYKPLDNQYQIKEAMEKTCKIVNQEKDPFAKALLLMILIAYIQPFEDGNKRTSRLMGNAILLAYNLCPLSYRSIDELEYKKAVILFYEQNNISYFKKLFMEQFQFVVENYFET